MIHGTADPILPFPHGEATAAAIPGTRFLPIEGMGHELPPPAVPIVVGAILELNLRCPEVPRALLIRVLRARPYAEGFLHCCVMLNPLSGEELEELLTSEE